MDLTKRQQYELLAAISARGEIPFKFAYLGEGASRWDKMYRYWSKDETEGVTDEEIALLDSHIDGVLNVFGQASGINLIDLGCGNGLPAIYLLKKLAVRNIATTYVPVDISKAMLELTEENIRGAFPEIKLEAIELDFEKEGLTDRLFTLKQHNNFSNFLINLGNTLGNYINASAVLTNFLEAMALDDYLLVGNGLINDQNPQKIISSYDNKPAANIVTGPARELGLFDKKDEFAFIWNANISRVEGRIKLHSRREVSLAEQTIELEPNDEILAFRSHKYTEHSLMKMLSDVGFRTELLTTTRNRNYALAMIQPTRYSN